MLNNRVEWVCFPSKFNYLNTLWYPIGKKKKILCMLDNVVNDEQRTPMLCLLYITVVVGLTHSNKGHGWTLFY